MNDRHQVLPRRRSELNLGQSGSSSHRPNVQKIDAEVGQGHSFEAQPMDDVNAPFVNGTDRPPTQNEQVKTGEREQAC
jgi:hypothetical protein